jgi:hypothetical protein
VKEPQARGNGLSAESYAPLADLHPHMAGEMLDALREAGIAAYAAPSPPPGDLLDGEVADADLDVGSVADRLYVDAAMKRRAEQVLLDRLPQPAADDDAAGPVAAGAPPAGPAAAGSGDRRPASAERETERDEDAIWAEIVASFDRETVSGHDAAPPWPDEENVPRGADDPHDNDVLDQDSGQDTGRDAGQDRSGRLPTARVIKPADDELPDGDELDDELFEDDEAGGHFVPPDPRPLPSADPTTKGAWIALFGGPLYLLTAAILNWQVPGWAAFLAVAAFVGGFVVLVLRMGDDPRDPDDGAVV